MQKNKNFLQNLLTLTDFVDIIDKSVAWTGIEVVITGLTRNQFVGNSGTWVRIPPRPPNKVLALCKNLVFYVLFCNVREEVIYFIP